MKLRLGHIHLHHFLQSTLHSGVVVDIRGALLLTSCVTLDLLLNLSEAVSSSVNMENNNNFIFRLYDEINIRKR